MKKDYRHTIEHDPVVQSNPLDRIVSIVLAVAVIAILAMLLRHVFVYGIA